MAEEITVEAINAKLAKNERLTPEETKFVMSLPPDGTEPVPDDADKIDWGKAANLDAETQTPEEKQAAEEKTAAEKQKKELIERAKKAGLPETAAEEDIIKAEEKKREESDDPQLDIERVERELSKPEGQESLEGFTKREKAYFHQMRRDRRARQKAEEERDQALFNLAKAKREEPEKTKEGEAAEDPLAELAKKDPTDYLTVSEVSALLKKVLAAKTSAKKEEKKEMAGPDPARIKYLSMCDNEARSAHPEDYDAVIELSPEIISSNEKYLKEIAQAILDGENPAEKSYQLIKADPEFSKLFPAAEVKVKARKAAKEKKPEKTKEELEKERRVKEAQDALKKNQQKTKTTGNVSGEGGAAEDSDKIEGISIEEIFRMSNLEFARLPKKTRQAFLEKYG